MRVPRAKKQCIQVHLTTVHISTSQEHPKRARMGSEAPRTRLLASFHHAPSKSACCCSYHCFRGLELGSSCSIGSAPVHTCKGSEHDAAGLRSAHLVGLLQHTSSSMSPPRNPALRAAEMAQWPPRAALAVRSS